MATPTPAHTKARPVNEGIDGRLRTVVPTALLVVFVAALPVHTWWGRLLVVAGATATAAAGTLTWGRFTAVQWALRRAQIAWQARRPIVEAHTGDDPTAPSAPPESATLDGPPPPAAPSEHTPAGEPDHTVAVPVTAVSSGDEVGVDWSRGDLVAALNLHGHSHAPHWLHRRQITTPALVPIDELEERLNSLRGGEAPHTVDLVLQSRRLIRTPYGITYDTKLSGQPVAGQRRCLLIAHFDPTSNPAYYAARNTLPDAVAATMARIRRTVAAADCPATALNGHQLKALRRSTHPGAPAAPDVHCAPLGAVVRWGHLAPASTQGLFDTVYAIDPAAFTDQRLRDVWAIRAEAVTMTFRRDRRGWLGFVRVRSSTAPTAAPLPFLRTLPGQQAAAVNIGRPVAATVPVRTVFEPVPTLAGLSLPTGSDGQVLGADDVGRQLLLPLVPGAERIIAARVDLIYAQQLILRAEATGAKVTIVTADPHRWSGLVSPRITLAVEGEQLPPGVDQLHVYDDGIAAPSNAAAATLALTAPGGPEPAGHLTLDQHDDMIDLTMNGTVTRIRARVDPAEITHLPAAQSVRRAR